MILLKTKLFSAYCFEAGIKAKICWVLSAFGAVHSVSRGLKSGLFRTPKRSVRAMV